jgi:hypothetical protein
MAEIQFDFNANVRKTIKKNIVQFGKLCKRYPDNTELGSIINQIVDESGYYRCPACQPIKDNRQIKFCEGHLSTLAIAFHFKKKIDELNKNNKQYIIDAINSFNPDYFKTHKLPNNDTHIQQG